MKPHNIRLCAVFLAAPLSLAACSSSGADPDSSTTSSVASLGELKSGQVVDKTTFFQVTSAAANRSKTYSFATKIGAGGSVLTSSGVVDNTDATDRKRQITIIDPNGLESQMVIAGGEVYLKAGDGPEAKWTKTPLSPQVEQVLAGATQRIQDDQNIAKSITFVGEEDVNGAKTRHFTVTVDPQAATSSASPSSLPTPKATATASPAPASSVEASASVSGAASSTTVEYWLDDQNRTRKMVHTVAGLPTTTTYDKWGEPVTITVPAPDQVTEPTTRPANTPATTKS